LLPYNQEEKIPVASFGQSSMRVRLHILPATQNQAMQIEKARCMAVTRGEGFLSLKTATARLRQVHSEHIRRRRDTPIWKLEAALKCRSCKKGRYAPPVQVIRLTQREIAPYVWVHPDEER
jgi:hypothetical protein